MPEPVQGLYPAANLAANNLLREVLREAGLSTNYNEGIPQYGSTSAMMSVDPMGPDNPAGTAINVNRTRSPGNIEPFSPRTIALLANENWHVYMNQVQGTYGERMEVMRRVENVLRRNVLHYRVGGNIQMRNLRNMGMYSRIQAQYRENEVMIEGLRREQRGLQREHGYPVTAWGRTPEEWREHTANENVSHLMNMYAVQRMGFQGYEAWVYPPQEGYFLNPYGYSVPAGMNEPISPAMQQNINALPESFFTPQTPPPRPQESNEGRLGQMGVA